MNNSISYGDVQYIKELIIKGDADSAIRQLDLIPDRIIIEKESHTFGGVVCGTMVWIMLNVWGYQIPNDLYYSASFDANSSSISIALGCIASSIYTIGVGLFATGFMGVWFYGIGSEAYFNYVNSGHRFLSRDEWIKQTNSRKILLFAGAIIAGVILMAWHYYSYVSS